MSQPPNSVVGGRVSRNAIWNAVGYFLPSLAVAASSIVMARVLDPRQFGTYVLLVFVYGAGSQIAVWGLPAAATRFIAAARARNDEDAQSAVIAVVLRAGAVGAVLTSVVIAASGFFWYGAGVDLLLLAALVALPLGPTQLIVNLLVGRERFKELAQWQLAVGFANPLATIVVVLLGGAVFAVLVVDVITTTLGLAAIVRVARPLPLSTPASLPEGFWRFSWLYAAFTLLTIVVFQRSEVLFLERYGTRAAIAIYGVAFGIAQLVARVTGPMVTALIPGFARVVAYESGDQTTPARRALAIASLVGFALSGIGVALAPAIVRVLYGSQYAAADTPARWLLTVAWAIVLIPVISAIAQARAALPALIGATAVGAAVNISLDLLLIPYLDALGAALANATAQVVVVSGLLLWLRAAIPGLPLLRCMLAVVPAAAASLSALPWLTLEPAPALAGGVVSASAVFWFVGRLTGAIDRETVELLRSLVTRRRVLEGR